MGSGDRGAWAMIRRLQAAETVLIATDPEVIAAVHATGESYTHYERVGQATRDGAFELATRIIVDTVAAQTFAAVLPDHSADIVLVATTPVDSLHRGMAALIQAYRILVLPTGAAWLFRDPRPQVDDQ